MTPDTDELLHLTLLGEAAKNADCIVYVANDEGQIVAMNDLLCEVTGLSRKQLAETQLDQLDLPGTDHRFTTRVASLPYTLGVVILDVSAHRRRRR